MENGKCSLTWVASVYGVFDVSFTCCDPNTVIGSWNSMGIKSLSSLASSSDCVVAAAFPSWDCWGTMVVSVSAKLAFLTGVFILCSLFLWSLQIQCGAIFNVNRSLLLANDVVCWSIDVVLRLNMVNMVVGVFCGFGEWDFFSFCFTLSAASLLRPKKKIKNRKIRIKSFCARLRKKCSN